MRREPNISEQEAREIVEKMGRRESYSPKSMDDFYRNIGLDPAELEQPGKTVKKEAGTAMADEPSSGATGGSGNAAETHQRQTAQAVIGRVPHDLSPSPQDCQPQARVR